MRTVERAVELLGPIEPVLRTPAATDAAVPKRASGEVIERSGFPDAGSGISATPKEDKTKTPQGAPPTARLAPTIKVDRALLHRQRMIDPDGKRSANAENFRRIKRQILANITKIRAGAPTNLIMVTSALPGEGKTFCSINLAISIALEMNRTALLVDADVAKPSIPQTLGLPSGRGLLDVLDSGKFDISEALCKTDIGKLSVLPAGAPRQNSTELLASDAMRFLLRQMADRYRDRIIIFDSPPLLAASEAVALANQMGQVVLVVESGKTGEATVKTALGRMDSNIVAGLLLNKIERSGRAYHDMGHA